MMASRGQLEAVIGRGVREALVRPEARAHPREEVHVCAWLRSLNGDALSELARELAVRSAPARGRLVERMGLGNAGELEIIRYCTRRRGLFLGVCEHFGLVHRPWLELVYAEQHRQSPQLRL